MLNVLGLPEPRRHMFLGFILQKLRNYRVKQNIPLFFIITFLISVTISFLS